MQWVGPARHLAGQHESAEACLIAAMQRLTVLLVWMGWPDLQPAGRAAGFMPSRCSPLLLPVLH